MSSSRIFNSLEIVSYGESLESKRAIIIEILEKFGREIENVSIESGLQTRTVFIELFKQLPKIRSLKLSNITINRDNYEEKLPCVNVCRLECLELTDCRPNVNEILTQLPSEILKKLTIGAQNPQDLAALIERQSTIEDLSILNFDDNFNFPGDLFTNLELKIFNLISNREDNQVLL